MKQMKHVFSVVVSVAMMVAMVFVVPVQAAGNYVAQLYGKVTDAGQVVNKVVIDYGDGVKVSGADKDTYTVHATNYVQIGSNNGKVLQADGGGDVFGGDAARGGRNGLAEQKNDG